MDNYSIPLRERIIAVLLGLGLPIPATHRKECWGYDRDYEKHVYIPNDRQLQAFSQALDMSDSNDYHEDDIVAWVNEASGHIMSRRSYFIYKKVRPLYPEFKLPVEERIKIFNGLIAPPSSKEALEKASKRQAYYEKRAGQASQRNGEAEGSTEERDSISD